MKKQKRIVTLLLALALTLGLATLASAATVRDFPDYDSDAWYADAVRSAVEDGLLRGDDKGLLRPDGYLTRAEMAAIVNRSFGTYQKADITNYRDVKPGAWYYEDVAMAVHMGTYNGTSASTMDPDEPITRQEAMTVVARALQLDLEDHEDTSLSRFRDRGDVSAWALPYVRAMVDSDYIHGNEKRELAPRDNITRAEFAQIFHNIIQEYIVKEGTYTGDRSGNLLVRMDEVTLEDMYIDGDLIIGCGAADGTVTLDNVTVSGRIVVWGGGTEAVWMNNSTRTDELIVCRVDGPVKVIFDKDSTLAVHDTIQVEITPRAEEFPETEVIFYDISDILDAIGDLNDIVSGSEIHVSMDADLLALVGQTDIDCRIDNNSARDTYEITITRDDTGETLVEPFTLGPGHVLNRLTLAEPLPMGDYPCTATVARQNQTGRMEVSLTLHVAYLWAK